MAQTIKLKRSSTQGKVPTTSQLALGEIAINTYDGRIFFEKNDGSTTIEHIVTTDSITTGSITITGTTQTGTLTTTNRIDKQYLDDEVLNTSLNSATGSYATGDNFDNDGTFASLRAQGTTKGDVGLGNVENTALSTYTGNGGALDNQYITNGAGYTTNTGTVTNVTVGSGLDIEDAGTTPDITLDLSEFAETTGFSSAVGDYFIVLDGNAERKTTAGNINLSIFNNDSGFITDITTQTDSKYLRSNATDTATGALTFTGDSKFTGQTNFQIMGDSNAIFVSSSATYDPSNDGGKLFIGGYQDGNTATSGIIIDYADPSVNLTSELKTTNQIDIQILNQSTSKTTGALKVAGGVGIGKTLNVGEDVVAYASSDERYKDNIIPIRNPNEKIKQIGGYTFDWNDKHEIFKGKKDIGVVAQEIEKVLPEIVETRDNGYKAVKYEKIVALLIESNKELIKRVEELESKIK